MKTIWKSTAAGLVFLLVAGTAAAQTGNKKTGKSLSDYSTIVVERFSVEKNSATEEFPRGQEMGIQQNAVDRLLKSRLFEEVVDATDEASALAATDSVKNSQRRLLLSGTVVQYDKGSRAARWFVGMGAGATKVKVRFAFRDAESGAELLRTDCQGKFYGWVAFVGGSKEQATNEAAGDVVDGLLRAIKKNR